MAGLRRSVGQRAVRAASPDVRHSRNLSTWCSLPGNTGPDRDRARVGDDACDRTARRRYHGRAGHPRGGRGRGDSDRRRDDMLWACRRFACTTLATPAVRSWRRLMCTSVWRCRSCGTARSTSPWRSTCMSHRRSPRLLSSGWGRAWSLVCPACPGGRRADEQALSDHPGPAGADLHPGAGVPRRRPWPRLLARPEIGSIGAQRYRVGVVAVARAQVAPTRPMSSAGPGRLHVRNVPLPHLQGPEMR